MAQKKVSNTARAEALKLGGDARALEQQITALADALNSTKSVEDLGARENNLLRTEDDQEAASPTQVIRERELAGVRHEVLCRPLVNRTRDL